MGFVKEVRHGGWIELVLDRADRRNALSSALADELVDALERAAQTAKGIVLSARGPVFCAGADLTEGMSLGADRPSSRIQRALLGSPLFVVAGLRGGAYGAGIGLLAACPVVIGTTAATFGLPEARHDIFPLGVVPYLEAQVPRRQLLSLGVQGGSISATEALAAGLLTELVDDDQLGSRTSWWMDLVAERPEVAAQAKAWWCDPLVDERFMARVAGLEALLAHRLPAPDLVVNDLATNDAGAR